MQNNASVSSDESLNAENNKSDKKKTSATTLIRWILRIVFLLIILYEIVNKFTHPVEARIIGFIGVGIYLVLLRYSLVIAYRKNLKSFQFALIRNSILLGFLFAAWRWIFGYKCLSSEIGSVAFDFVLALFLLICILLSVIISIIVFIKREHRSMMDVYILVLIISGLCFLSLFPFIIKESQYIPEGLMGAVLNYSAMGFGMLFLFTVALTIPLIAFLYLRRKFTSVISFKFVVKRKLSYLAMATVGLGVFVLIIVTGVMGGFKAELRKRIRGSQSHLLVPISIPSSAQIKSNSEYSLPPFDEEMDKPDSTIYSALLDVEDTGKYEQFRKKVAEKYELEYKTLDQLSVEWDFEYQEKNDPLIYKALKKKVGFIEKANNAKTLETALRQKFDFEDSLTNPEMILKTRAILLGFTDEKDLRLIRHPQDLVALCRTDYLDKTMRRYREIILKLNDSEYRKELLEFIESRGNVVDSEWSGFMAPQSKVYEESKRILAGTARDEKIIEGASGRLRTMALIIKEQNREIDYCQIMAIDPSNDLLISDLGVYLQHALYYELNQHLVKNLYNTAMLVAREFSVTENEYYSPKIVRDDELTPVGRELFAEIMTTASLISKSPQEDRYPELPLKQQILLNDLRDNLTTIINRHRDKIVAEYMGKGLSFEDARAKARKESKEYVLINDMRGRIITGFYTFNKTLNSLISGKYSKYLCVDSTIELKGFNKSVIITPKPLKDKLLQIIKVGNKFISMQKNYTAKQIAFDDIKNSIINTTTDYLDKDWSNVKTALKNADENAVKTCFPLLSGIEGQISTDELDEIELHLINLLKLFEQTTLRANMSDDSTFWDIEDFSVISLDKIIDTDFSKVRHMLRFMTDGQSPFKGVMLKWDGSVKVQSSDVKDLLADDVITGIENKKIENFEDIRQIFKNLKFESKIKLQFIRKKGGKGTETLNAELVYNQELIIMVLEIHL